MSTVQRSTPMSMQEAILRLVPALMPSHKVLPQTMSTTLIQGVEMALYLKVDGGMTPVTCDDMRRWGADVEQLAIYARRNLESCTSSCMLEVSSINDCSVVHIRGRDGHDPARLLLIDFLLNQMQNMFGQSHDEYVAFVPNDQAVYMVPSRTPAPLIAKYARFIADHAAKTPQTALFAAPFILTRDGIVSVGNIAQSYGYCDVPEFVRSVYWHRGR